MDMYVSNFGFSWDNVVFTQCCSLPTGLIVALMLRTRTCNLVKHLTTIWHTPYVLRTHLVRKDESAKGRETTHYDWRDWANVVVPHWMVDPHRQVYRTVRGGSGDDPAKGCTSHHMDEQLPLLLRAQLARPLRNSDEQREGAAAGPLGSMNTTHDDHSRQLICMSLTEHRVADLPSSPLLPNTKCQVS